MADQRDPVVSKVMGVAALVLGVITFSLAAVHEFAWTAALCTMTIAAGSGWAKGH